MEQFLCPLDELDDPTVFSPEKLAWHLLTSDNTEALHGALMAFIESDEQYSSSFDQQSGLFEILITIYMEMVFGILKINHYCSLMNEEGELDSNVDIEKSFKPDFTKFKLNDLVETFQNKFNKFRYYLHVTEIDNSYEKDYNKYYCKILLKDTQDGQGYFWSHRKQIPADKRYTFVIKGVDNNHQESIKDFYAICTLPNIKVKISFSEIKVIPSVNKDVM